MGTSWAVGASLTLAIFAAIGLVTTTAGAILGIIAFGTWAYAIAMAAHGDRGALAALFVNAVAAAAVGASGLRGGFVWTVTRDLLCAALLVVAILSAWAIFAELRSRRGRVAWGTAVLFSLPTILVAWQTSVFVVTPHAFA